MINNRLSEGIALLLGLSCLALAVAATFTDQRNRRLQQTLQERAEMVQAEISGLRNVEAISQNILEELGRVAVTNTEVRVLLARHGYTLRDGNTVAPDVLPEREGVGDDALAPATIFPPSEAETEWGLLEPTEEP